MMIVSFNMGLIITPLEDSPFTYEDVVVLIHSSFEERIREGLNFTCSFISAPQFKEKTKKGIVLVAWDETSHELLGTATVTLHKDSDGIVYGYNEYLAVRPSEKRTGLGTRLLKERIMIIIRAGGQYVMSDTAVGAKSSVKWHLKNGFKKVALRSYQTTNYYSYVFRKQLTNSARRNHSICIYMRFMCSCLKTKLLYRKDGKRTYLGRLKDRIEWGN